MTSFVYKADPVRGAAWARLFAERMPEIDFRIWPDIGDPAAVRFLAAWRPPADVMGMFPNLEVLFSVGAGVDQFDFAGLPPDLPVVRIIEDGITGGMVGHVTLSKSKVSLLRAELDEWVGGSLSCPVEGDWPYLWLDVTYVRVRQPGRIVSVVATIAVGINSDGRREVLGVATDASAAETFWTDFLRSLAQRGLRGVKLVIADAHEGSKVAARGVLHATSQRCRLHSMRDALAHVGMRHRHRHLVSAWFDTAFAEADAEGAER